MGRVHGRDCAVDAHSHPVPEVAVLQPERIGRYDADTAFTAALLWRQGRILLLAFDVLLEVSLKGRPGPAHQLCQHCLALKLAPTPGDALVVVEQVLVVSANNTYVNGTTECPLGVHSP